MLRSTTIAVVAGCAVLVGAGAARADETVVCPPGGTVCYIVVVDPGDPGTGQVSNPGGPGPLCHEQGSTVAVPCYDPTFGWWSNTDGCYYHRLVPPPPATNPAWEGHYPDGAIYESTCPGGAGFGGGWDWRPTPPPGYGGGPGTAAQLAQDAIARLNLRGPDIGFAPSPGATGLVGLPVWMWNRVASGTWGTETATATLPGLSVTATAHAKKIVWTMGDGQSVTCAGPGTPYSQRSGHTTSPTCGYTYRASSAGQTNDAFHVVATTTWEIAWRGAGSNGQVTQTRSSSVNVRIGELQVLVS